MKDQRSEVSKIKSNGRGLLEEISGGRSPRCFEPYRFLLVEPGSTEIFQCQ